MVSHTSTPFYVRGGRKIQAQSKDTHYIMTKHNNQGQIPPEELIWIQLEDNKITVFKLNEFIV